MRIYSLFSRDSELLRSFESDVAGTLTGGVGEEDFSLSFSLDKSGALKFPVSAIWSTGNGSICLIRNRSDVLSASAEALFEADRELPYMFVKKSGRTLEIFAEDCPDSFSMPGEIDSILVNGKPVAFDRDGEKILITDR
jgi:hypothetical protein